MRHGVGLSSDGQAADYRGAPIGRNRMSSNQSGYSRRGFLRQSGASLATIAAATISPGYLKKAHAGETLTLMMSQPQVAGARQAAAAFLEATGIFG